MRRVLPLLLSLALLPHAALASYPPCPADDAPPELQPIDGPKAEPGPRAWSVVRYAFAGDPNVVSVLSANPPGRLKCDDNDILPISEPHDSDADADWSVSAQFAPKSGFVVLSLPSREALRDAAAKVEHTLRFEVGAVQWLKAGEWLDIAELRFAPNTDTSGQELPSAVYRVRRHQGQSGGLLEVIDGTKLEARGRVLASIALPPDVSTPVALRWRQAVAPASHGFCSEGDVIGCETLSGDSSPMQRRLQNDRSAGTVDLATTKFGADGSRTLSRPVTNALLEVLGPGDTVLNSAKLDAHHAEFLLMGVLDYRVSKTMQQADWIGKARLGVRLLP